jgi:hypothetical protein
MNSHASHVTHGQYLAPLTAAPSTAEAGVHEPPLRGLPPLTVDGEK